jgi:GNAT superfamily N-acetyltransferase
MVSNPEIAQESDGAAVFELVRSARDQIPLKAGFYHDQNEKWISKLCSEGNVWVAKDGNTIIAASILYCDEVFYLVVSSSYRRQGIARSLLREAKGRARWIRMAATNTAMAQLLADEGCERDLSRTTEAGWHAYRI